MHTNNICKLDLPHLIFVLAFRNSGHDLRQIDQAFVSKIDEAAGLKPFHSYSLWFKRFSNSPFDKFKIKWSHSRVNCCGNLALNIFEFCWKINYGHKIKAYKIELQIYLNCNSFWSSRKNLTPNHFLLTIETFFTLLLPTSGLEGCRLWDHSLALLVHVGSHRSLST